MWGRSREVALAALAASKSIGERIDRHEDGCVDTWREVRQSIKESQDQNAAARVRTEAMHLENQAAIGRVNNRIFALLLTVAGTVIVMLLTTLAVVIWYLATHHGSL